MRDFRSLKVWEKAHQLVLDLYRATERMPRAERFGLTSQMRRASVSIPSNIVEGCGRDGDRELGRFLRIASGSASELEYQLLLARDLEMLEDQTCGLLMGQVAEVRRMIAGLLRTLKQHSEKPKTITRG